MLKMIALARRRGGMMRAEYMDYIFNVHGAIARQNPIGLASYRQSPVYGATFGSKIKNDDAGVFHGDIVIELHFENPGNLAHTFSDEYTRTVVAPDSQNFAELSTNAAAVARETVLIEPASCSERAKITHLLAPIDGDLSAAQAAWGGVHSAALQAAPDFAKAPTGVIRSDAAPPGAPADAHLGAVECRPPRSLPARECPMPQLFHFADMKRLFWDRENSTRH